MAEPKAVRTPMLVRFSSDEERWTAAVNRDHAAAEEFVYSVATTGVYCRPGCAARRPRREHVRFHASCKVAENAGFRPCRSCRPNEPPLAERHAEAVATACRLIETAEEVPDLNALAQAAGMSRFHFHRVFKAIAGCTPQAYAAAHRADRMRETLRTSQTVTDAICDSGFNSSVRFYAAAAATLGMAPSTFRHGGTGEKIRFAVGECSLGSILVAATTEGVCAIVLGDDPTALVRQLEDSFAGADLVGGDPEFESVVARVIGFVEAPALGLDLAARHPRNGVSAADMAGAQGSSGRYDCQLRHDRRSSRLAESGAGGGAGMCLQSACRRDSLPPGGPERRRTRRLSLGSRTQASPARPRGFFLSLPEQVMRGPRMPQFSEDSGVTADRHASWLFLEKREMAQMNVKELLAGDCWSGGIDFRIETRNPDLVVARMLVTDSASWCASHS